MNIAAVVMIASCLEIVRPVPVDPDAIIARFERECAASASSEPCKVLRQQVEQILFQDLITLQSLGAAVNPEVYRTIARADNPAVQALGIRGLTRPGFDAARDGALLQSALESRVPAVRLATLHAASEVDYQPILLLRARVYQGNDADGSDTNEVDVPGTLLADKTPDANALGAAMYPGADYRFFASGGELAYFSTTDSAEKVITFYTKNLKDKKIYTRKDLQAMEDTEPDPNAMMKMIMNGGGENFEEQMKKAMSGASGYDWGTNIEGRQGVDNPRYIILDEGNIMGKRVPSKVVVVFKDQILGATAIAFPRPPKSPEIDMDDPGRTQRLAQRKKRTLQPEPQGSDPD